MKDAFGVERISKAATGEKGDKRNTKYVLAGLTGGLAGANLGSYLGASKGAKMGAKAGKAGKGAPMVLIGALEGATLGGAVGGVGGAAGGAGLYAAHRHSKKGKAMRRASVRAKKDDVKKLHEVNKAWNAIFKPKAGVVPETFAPMTAKDIAAAGKKGNQMAAMSNKKAQKVMAQQTQSGQQVAPGVREYKPEPPAAPKPKKDKKPKTFFERNRKGLMWGAGGVGAGGLGGYALSRDTA